MEGTIEKVENSGSSGTSGTYGLPSFKEYQDILAKQTAANNAWSAEQAQKQMDFQERMSNTAHQREVADLKAAGLNPVLSAGGSGAASLAGAQANPDQSGNNALTTFLVNLVNAQNQMEMQRLSAETAIATAGMYNATSELVASIGAAASNYASDAATLRQREALEYQENHPNTLVQALTSVINQYAKKQGTTPYETLSGYVNKWKAGIAAGVAAGNARVEAAKKNNTALAQASTGTGGGVGTKYNQKS